MVRINLLPPHIKEARRKAKNLRRLGLAMGVLIVVLLMSLGFLRMQNYWLALEIDAVRDQKDAVERSIEQHQVYLDLEAQVREQEQILQRAMGPAPDLDRILVGLGDRIPNHVWLTEMRLVISSTQEEPGELSMRGYTYNHKATARWHDLISGMSQIEQVRLSTSVQEERPPYLLVRYDLTADVKAGEIYQPPVDGVD